ncbi:MAG: hypothetical protein LBU32_32920 [Clostridiales bacterium]|nr:hypothetical protein [Clostridiales bacterium]
MHPILEKLRETSASVKVGALETEESAASLSEFLESGVKLASSHPKIEDVYYRAIRALMKCIVKSPSGAQMLIEGAVFIGCWLESTGTISAETLSRFCPNAAQSSFLLFADFKREDGLIPYKITDAGPAFRQVQMATPLARSVWRHYRLNPDKTFLEKMYRAISENDKWLETWRDTRKTGCVEAFCTFDTGHDASPRFWHVKDAPLDGDPAKCDPDSPILPFLAPDMTANVYCQRLYLAKMAEELGGSANAWREKAERTYEALMKQCYDQKDHFFYDRDRLDRFVKIQSDILIRVLACEVGDDAMFEDALRRYLLNTKKFFSRYPITTIAMDDPRFSQMIEYNSWSGQISFLTQLRLPIAFELHRRYVELTWIMNPILTALSRFENFAGGLSAWLGIEGYSSNYSPTMLCVLDYLERMCGIYPVSGNELWFTALAPAGMDYGEIIAEETAYSRIVKGRLFELANEKDRSFVFRDGELMYEFPKGVRLVTDETGRLKGLIGMSVRMVEGFVCFKGEEIPFSASGNETLEYSAKGFASVDKPGVVPPNYGEMDERAL